MLAAGRRSAVVFAFWATVPTWRDELTVYRDGFSYRRRGRVWTCRWDEIADLPESLETGRRLVATSVTRRDGERLRFAYRMRGLDVVSQAHHDATTEAPSTVEEPPLSGLGEQRSVHTVHYGWGDVGVLALVGLPGLVMLAYTIDRPGVASFVCVAPFLFGVTMLAWPMVRERHDVLTVYANGFTYRRRGRDVTCRWDEIEDYQRARRGNQVTAVKKQDGPWIAFAGSMRGLDEITPHARTVVRRVEGPPTD